MTRSTAPLEEFSCSVFHPSLSPRSKRVKSPVRSTDDREIHRPVRECFFFRGSPVDPGLKATFSRRTSFRFVFRSRWPIPRNFFPYLLVFLVFAYCVRLCVWSQTGTRRIFSMIEHAPRKDGVPPPPPPPPPVSGSSPSSSFSTDSFP